MSTASRANKEIRKIVRRIARLHKPVIGQAEWIGLPDLGIAKIKTRIDTGARTSALHAFDIEKFHKGRWPYLRFKVYTGDTKKSRIARCEARLIDERLVKNSSGVREQRYVIKTRMVIGRHRFDCELSLADRKQMKFNMLLGRLAMHDRFLVDPDHVFLQGKPKPDPD